MPLPAPSGFQHTVVVGELEPGRSYVYRVSSDAGYTPEWSDCFETRTAPAGADAGFEAAFLCDVGLAGRADGTTTAAPEVLEAIRHSDPHVVLGGGDYVYADKDRRFLDPGEAIGAWLDAMQPLFARAPFIAQLGNHEIELTERLADWSPRLPRPAGGPSGLSYALDIGCAHVVGLHAPGRAPSPADLSWLESDLRSAAARSARWRIVFQHAPIFAHGTSHPARPEVTQLADIFDRLGIDLHLSGHDQSFERTHALRRDGTVTPPEPGDGPATYRAGRGVVYAKISPAGKLSDRGRGFSRLPEQAPPFIAARSDRGHHWARVIVAPEALRLVVHRLDGPGETVTIADECRLLHPQAGPSVVPDPDRGTKAPKR